MLLYEHNINVMRTVDGSKRFSLYGSTVVNRKGCMPESVVIVRRTEGWVAHVRYANRFLDKDISSAEKYLLNRKIDFLFRGLKSW